MGQNSQSTTKEKRNLDALDPVLIILTCSIVISLTVSAYFVLGTLSIVALALAGVLLLYNLLSARGNANAKQKHGKKGLSVFMLFLMITPFILATVVAYDGYTLWNSGVRILLL